MNFDYPSGATPLDPDEIEGLLLSHIANRSELDRWEQDNIMEAECRQKYIDALQNADRRDYEELFQFV